MRRPACGADLRIYQPALGAFGLTMPARVLDSLANWLHNLAVLDDLLDLVPSSIGSRSGSVFYSGRSAFNAPAPLYLLGLNPGGSPDYQSDETITRHIDAARVGREKWSAYADESWRGGKPGTYGLQPRVLHLLRGIGLDPRSVPASNVVFVRSRREADLVSEKRDLLTACWPVHQAVIERLRVRVVACFGGTAGRWARDTLGAHEKVGEFVENNLRRWSSTDHRNSAGLHVLTLTHPSIAAWNVAATDPTPLVRAALID